MFFFFQMGVPHTAVHKVFDEFKCECISSRLFQLSHLINFQENQFQQLMRHILQQLKCFFFFFFLHFQVGLPHDPPHKAPHSCCKCEFISSRLFQPIDAIHFWKNQLQQLRHGAFFMLSIFPKIKEIFHQHSQIFQVVGLCSLSRNSSFSGISSSKSFKSLSLSTLNAKDCSLNLQRRANCGFFLFAFFSFESSTFCNDQHRTRAPCWLFPSWTTSSHCTCS